VTGIKTLLNTITITLQDGRESNQEDLSGHKDSTTSLLDKGKIKESMPLNHEIKDFNKWIKMSIGTARVYKILFMTLLRLLKKDWE